MAPLKKEMESKNKSTAVTVLQFLKGKELEEKHLDEISHFKGMINRCVRQDQWDWFTVYALFKQPSPSALRRLNKPLTDVRKGYKERNQKKIERAKQELIDQGVVNLCLYYLGEKKPKYEEEYGYLYILSRREDPGILKIGMTTRDVEVRTKEINSATGVLYPHSVRGVFRVNDARKAEKEIFVLLDAYRVRQDREFLLLIFIKHGVLLRNI